MLIYAQNSHSFLHLLVITCITIQSISVLYDTNNKLLVLFIVCFYYHSQIINISVYSSTEDMLIISVVKTVKTC